MPHFRHRHSDSEKRGMARSTPAGAACPSGAAWKPEEALGREAAAGLHERFCLLSLVCTSRSLAGLWAAAVSCRRLAAGHGLMSNLSTAGVNLLGSLNNIRHSNMMGQDTNQKLQQALRPEEVEQSALCPVCVAGCTAMTRPCSRQDFALATKPITPGPLMQQSTSRGPSPST